MAPLFLASRYMHIFFTRRFFRLFILLVINELTAIFVYLPAINRYKNQRGVYEWVNISDDLVYEWVLYFKGQVYECCRFRNTGSFTRTKFYAPTPSPNPHAPSAVHLQNHRISWISQNVLLVSGHISFIV